VSAVKQSKTSPVIDKKRSIEETNNMNPAIPKIIDILKTDRRPNLSDKTLAKK
jgi:hypothetical protein